MAGAEAYLRAKFRSDPSSGLAIDRQRSDRIRVNRFTNGRPKINVVKLEKITVSIENPVRGLICESRDAPIVKLCKNV